MKHSQQFMPDGRPRKLRSNKLGNQIEHVHNTRRLQASDEVRLRDDETGMTLKFSVTPDCQSPDAFAWRSSPTFWDYVDPDTPTTCKQCLAREEKRRTRPARLLVNKQEKQRQHFERLGIKPLI